MKKKLLFLLVGGLFLLGGCGKATESDIIKDLTKKINNANSYYIEGILEIVNNEDIYTYDVEVSYAKKDNYKVRLVNNVNNHEQIILRNSEGVYVVTPRINKSFKFQSDWPYDNSQIYLLSALVNDIKNDDSKKYTETKNGYTFTTKVNYPNNSKLVSQKIELNKKLNIKKVTVYDKNNIGIMTMKYKSIDYSPTFKKDYFDLDKIMKEVSIDNSLVEETGSLEDSIYPLTLPSGTKLTNEERVKKDDGERIIMTFDGEKSFLLVEETVNIEDEPTIIPTYGEPFRLMDTIGVMTDNSLSWTTGGIEYYLVSDVLNQNELIDVAQSINVLPTMK